MFYQTTKSAPAKSAQMVRDRVPRHLLQRSLIVAIVVGFAGPTAHSASAQYRRQGYTPYGARMPGTAASAAEFGMARMIAASGNANLMNSQAAKNYMAARSADFRNRVQWTNSYYQMRQAHRTYEADHTHLTMDEITKIAQDAAPKQLDVTQLDSATGVIHWPIILQDIRYIGARDELDHQFKVRSISAGSIDADSYRDIQGNCEQLKTQLRDNINEYSANDFEHARHFIENLEYEAKFPHG